MNYLVLAKSVKVVFGFMYAIIIDFKSQSYYRFLKENIIQSYSEKHHSFNLDLLKEDIKSELLDLQDSSNIGYFHSDYKGYNFLDVEAEVEMPFHFIDAIIDIASIESFHINLLKSISTAHLIIRFVEPSTKGEIEIILSYLKENFLESIQLVLPYTANYENMIDLFNHEKRIWKIEFYNAPSNEVYNTDFRCIIFNINNLDQSHCGIIDENYFTMNAAQFDMSLKKNSCLYKKVFIDEFGNIKNCPSMQKGFRNVKDYKLNDLISNNEFLEVGNIHKDQIDTCKDCEFRYICSDCRAFLEEPENIYSKPLKCGYDPYSGKWEDWTESTFKQSVAEFYENQS